MLYKVYYKSEENVGEFSFYTPPNKVWGVYWFHPVHLSVCLTVCRSASWSASLSLICGHDFVHACSKRWAHGFSENLYTDYSPSKDVHLEFSY